MIDDGKRVAAGGARFQWHMIPIADIDLIARDTGGEENGVASSPDIMVDLKRLRRELESANSAELLHNDPMPPNIIFGLDNNEPLRAWLVDFELAQDLAGPPDTIRQPSCSHNREMARSSVAVPRSFLKLPLWSNFR